MSDSWWRREARAAIDKAHATVPDDADLKARTAIIDAAYPFGPRKYHPYKMWLKERAAYLSRYGYVKKGKLLHESPLERLMRRGQSKQ